MDKGKEPTRGVGGQPREPQDRGSNIRLPSNATPEQAMRAIFQIPPAEAKRIVESKPARESRTPRH